MQNRQAIIEQYLSADEEERLAMYLSYRDCRRQFVKLDMAALKAVREQQTAAQAAQRKRSRHSEFQNTCLGWLKRCWTVR